MPPANVFDLLCLFGLTPPIFALTGSCTLALVGRLDGGRVRPFKMFDGRLATEDQHVSSLSGEASEWLQPACCLSLCLCERGRGRERERTRETETDGTDVP